MAAYNAVAFDRGPLRAAPGTHQHYGHSSHYQSTDYTSHHYHNHPYSNQSANYYPTWSDFYARPAGNDPFDFRANYAPHSQLDPIATQPFQPQAQAQPHLDSFWSTSSHDAGQSFHSRDATTFQTNTSYPSSQTPYLDTAPNFQPPTTPLINHFAWQDDVHTSPADNTDYSRAHSQPVYEALPPTAPQYAPLASPIESEVRPQLLSSELVFSPDDFVDGGGKIEEVDEDDEEEDEEAVKVSVKSPQSSTTHKRKLSRSFAQDAPASSPRKQKVRGKFKPERRQQVAQNRKVGACIRCRIYRISVSHIAPSPSPTGGIANQFFIAQCDGLEHCNRCINVCGKSRVFHEPCWRVPLSDACLARPGNARFGQIHVDHLKYNWDSSAPGTSNIELHWTIPGASAPFSTPIRLAVRRFVPSLSETETYTTWSIGSAPVSLSLPPFAVASPNDLTNPMTALLKAAQPELEAHFLSNLFSPILQATFLEAQRNRSTFESSSLRHAFQILSGSLLSQGWGALSGPDTLGISRPSPFHLAPSPQDIRYEKYLALSLPSTRLIPEAIDHALDVSILRHLRALHKPLFKALRDRIFPTTTSTKTPTASPPPSQPAWYEVFLTLFVLLSNLEYISASAAAYLASQRGTDTERAAQKVVDAMQDEWSASAGNLLAHFAGALRGAAPFRARDENDSALDGCDQKARAFVVGLAARLRLCEGFSETNPNPNLHQDADVEDVEQIQLPGKWTASLFKLACQVGPRGASEPCGGAGAGLAGGAKAKGKARGKKAAVTVTAAAKKKKIKYEDFC
ncbi:MAG: hypothetical protein M1814_006739 [Vezdaea aestivalis]|nr:MAG: hypothetical protein M1814_006739 [Vezdaea aestivalis]